MIGPFRAAPFRVALAFCFIALCSALAGLPARAQDCALKPLASLDMRTNAGGTFTIPVKVNGTDYQFLVDTGGVFSTLNPDIAKSQHMVQRKMAVTLEGVAARQFDTMVNPDDFWVGPVLHSSKFWFYLRPPADHDLNGTLSPDFLRGYDIDIDYAGGKFNIIDPDHCPGKVVYWNPDSFVVVPIDTTGGDQHAEIPVTIDGKPITASIDTGSSFTIMSMKTAKALGVDEKDPALKSFSQRIDGKDITTYTYPFKTIQFAGIGAGSFVTISNPNIVIFEDSAMQYFKVHLVLGASALRQLHVYIAYKEHKMYLSPAQKSSSAPAH